MAQPQTVSFTPRQLLQPNADLYVALVDDTTKNVAAYALTQLPVIPPESVIHDNGCGCGEAIQAIMATNPPSNITIKATDLDPSMLSRCRQSVSSHGWPVEVSSMRAEALAFADNTFTHSIGNFLIFMTARDGLDCAIETYRTLRPGGRAVLTTWKTMPHSNAVDIVHRTMRGSGEQLMHVMPEYWWEGSHLRKVLEGGGFSGDKIALSTAEVQLRIKDIHHYATMIWSLRGIPSSGWKREDEESWDRAISMLVNEMKKLPESEMLESGELSIKMVANVAIAIK